MNENILEGKKILFFDTETSGFISKSKAFDDPEQAWCIQIGAIMADGTTGEDIELMNTLIKPDGRTMHPAATAVHGITLEQAETEGISELDAIESFGKLIKPANLIVCHNYDFDWAYVIQMMQRNTDDMSDLARSSFYEDKPGFCTMKDKAIQQYVDVRMKNGRIKWPKLMELYKKLRDDYETETGEAWFLFDESDAHDAFADIMATKMCFFELIRKGIGDLPVF